MKQGKSKDNAVLRTLLNKDAQNFGLIFHKTIII